MKKLVLLSAAAVAMLAAACGGNKSESAANDNSAEFAASQPLASGEYRAVSFQDTAADAVRTRFDGRILIALDPNNSGIYIYENGNRTHFKASVPLSEAFTASDTIFVAKDKEANARSSCGKVRMSIPCLCIAQEPLSKCLSNASPCPR